jgi:hypothetical protein
VKAPKAILGRHAARGSDSLHAEMDVLRQQDGSGFRVKPEESGEAWPGLFRGYTHECAHLGAVGQAE